MRTLYDDFEKACHKICKEFSIHPPKIEFHKKLETPKVGVDYVADIRGEEYTIRFSIRTESEVEDPTHGSIRAQLYI